MRKELFKHNWNFILYEEDGIRFIDVVFYNSFVDTSKMFLLKEEEFSYDFEQLKKLAEDIRNNYEKHKDREIIEI